MDMSLPTDSNFQCAGVWVVQVDRIRLFRRRQAELDTQNFAVPWEVDYDPLRAAHATSPEIATKDPSRDAEPERSQVALQIGLDAADNHVGQLGNGVEHFLVHGGRFGHQHLRTDGAGQVRRATDTARADPGARDPDERNHAVSRFGGAQRYRVGSWP